MNANQPYQFNPQARRFHALAAHLLTSKLFVGLLILVCLGAAGSWYAGWLGLTLVLSGLAGLMATLFAFGLTYFPYLPPPKTIIEIEESSGPVNVAEAATFWLLGSLGTAAQVNTSQSLAAAIERLCHDPVSQAAVRRLHLTGPALVTLITEKVLPGLTWDELWKLTLTVAHRLHDPYMTPLHVLGALLLHPAFHAAARAQQLQDDDLMFVIWWQNTLQHMHLQERRWWAAENILRFTGIGLSWTSGYTPLIDRFLHFPAGNIWNQLPLGREDYVKQVIHSLARDRQSNVLVVGQPGVGRLGVVKEVERRVRAKSAHPHLNGLRVMYINLGQLISAGTSPAGQLNVITQMLSEVERAGNIIAVFDGISSILGTRGEERVNLTEALLPFLSSGEVRVIVIVSQDDYHERLRKSAELIHLFEVVSIPPLSEEKTLELLALITPTLEHRNNLYVPYQTLDTLMRTTSSLFPDVPYPERAFDVLAEVMVTAQEEGVTEILPDHITRYLSEKIGLEMGHIEANEQTILLSLEERMHERIVNQHQAVQAVTRAMIRARTGVRSTDRPIGTFLFLGPTGVGKTETAKTLAEAYFGSEDKMLRLDMSEFHGTDAIDRLIGSDTYSRGRLTALVADHPFSVVLLDEFEKAAPEVHQLFLPIFDEGFVTDARGRKVSFVHTILIATSNAGAQFIRERLKLGPLAADFENDLKDHILKSNIFRPELLNRFDGVITFTPLSPAHVLQIAGLMIRKLNKRLDAEHGVTIAATDDLLNYLVSIGYSPEFGARPMARAIQNTVEYAIAQKILRQEIEPGETITLTAAEIIKNS